MHLRCHSQLPDRHIRPCESLPPITQRSPVRLFDCPLSRLIRSMASLCFGGLAEGRISTSCPNTPCPPTKSSNTCPARSRTASTTAFFQSSSRLQAFRLAGSLLICLLSLLVIETNGEMCKKLKSEEVFHCPRLFESKKKSWCCGSNSFDSHCCEWSKRAKETIPDLNFKVVNDASFKFIFMALVSVLFIAMLLVICCYLVRNSSRFSEYSRPNAINDGRCLMDRVAVNRDGSTQLSNAHSGQLPPAPYPNSASYPTNQPIVDDPPPSYFDLYSTNKIPLSDMTPVAPPIVEANSHDQKAGQPLLPNSSGDDVRDADSQMLSKQPPFNPAFISK